MNESSRFIVREIGIQVTEMFAITAESPNSPGDSRDRAVITVDYRRYHEITGLERNEIVRQHVGAKQAEKKVTIAEYGRSGQRWCRVGGRRRRCSTRDLVKSVL